MYNANFNMNDFLLLIFKLTLFIFKKNYLLFEKKNYLYFNRKIYLQIVLLLEAYAREK